MTIKVEKYDPTRIKPSNRARREDNRAARRTVKQQWKDFALGDWSEDSDD